MILSIHVSVRQLPDLSFPPSFSSLSVCLAFDFLLSTHDYMPCGVLLFTLEMPSSWPPGDVQIQVENTCSLAPQDFLVFHSHSKEPHLVQCLLAKHLLDVFSFFLQPKVWLDCSQWETWGLVKWSSLSLSCMALEILSRTLRELGLCLRSMSLLYNYTKRNFRKQPLQTPSSTPLLCPLSYLK